jgi:hypothetical protein
MVRQIIKYRCRAIKYIFWGLSLIAAAGLSFAETPPMVDRHIFTPENTSEQKPDSVPGPADGSDLLKDIQFTGVMTTIKGKQAIIVESSKKDSHNKRHIVKEGDLIKGLTLKEIGPNYVLIVAKENSVKLNLYKGAKTRPNAPAEPAPPEPFAAQPAAMNPSAPGGPASVQQQIPSKGTGKSDLMPNKGPADNQSLLMPATGDGPGSFGELGKRLGLARMEEMSVTGVGPGGYGGTNSGSSTPQVPASGNNPPVGKAGGQAVNPFIMPAN